VRFHPSKDGQFRLETRDFKKHEPGVYERVDDGWWGIASHDQDTMAQESRG